MMSLENNVKNYLKSKHIKVPEEWIPSCLEFIREDNPQINISNTRIICEKVFEQWLHCDLTELASCCLPFGLSQKRITTVNGPFILQVNCIRDVGHPAYPQLQKLRKAENNNAEVSADRQFQPLWEPKPTRMLMMQMTDGTSMVRGIEYRPIPQLNVNLKPGTKVLISGSIRCRRGVLMLMQDQITILGGSTESLRIINAGENVLARALGVEETDEPKEMQEIVATQVPPSQASQYYPSQINRAPNTSQRPPQTTQGRGMGRPPPAVNRRPSVFTAPPPPTFDDMGDDDFLDSDLEATLNQIESQASSIQSNISQNRFTTGYNTNSQISNKRSLGTNSVTSRNTKMSVPNQNANTSTWQPSETDIDIGEEFFNDDFEDELILSADAAALEMSSQIPSSSSTQGRNTFTPAVIKPHGSVPNNSLKSAERLPFFKTQSNNSTPRSQNPVNAIAPQKVNKPGMSSFATSKNLKVPTNQSKLTNFLPKQSLVKNESNLSTKSPLRDSGIPDEIDDDVLMQFEETYFTEEASFSGRDAKRMKTSDQEKISEKAKRKPFTYLFFIPERSTSVQEFVVKGFIMTLASKLDVFEGNWRLAAVINDGSSSREVDVDNKVLCQLIGMTCSEFQKKKRESRMNPFNTTLQQQVSKSVINCQHKLISLCSLLTLSLSPGEVRPKLVNISPVTASTAMELSSRSTSL